MSAVSPVKRRYLEADAEVQGHIHANLRSCPQTKTHGRWHARRLADLQAQRDDAREALRAEEAAQPEPSRGRLEYLSAIASGPDESAAAQAARRLILKQFGITWGAA